MQRLLSLAAACLISCALAFGQGTAADQSAATSGTPQSSTPATAAPNSSGTAGATSRGRAARSASRSNQALPGNSNPSNATTSDAGANGQAVQPNGAQSGAAATAPSDRGNSGDNSDNGGMAKDATGNNPASGRGSNTFTSPGTSGTTPWFWLALIIVIALFAIGLALRGRNRVRANIEPTDPAIRAAGEQKDADVRRREDQIRKVG